MAVLHGFGGPTAAGTMTQTLGSRFPWFGGSLMYFAAAVLLVLSGLFYAAGQHQIGSLGVDMCRYGSTFCDNPVYVLTGAGLAAVWGKFVSIR
jgi:hypothetical protein